LEKYQTCSISFIRFGSRVGLGGNLILNVSFPKKMLSTFFFTIRNSVLPTWLAISSGTAVPESARCRRSAGQRQEPSRPCAPRHDPEDPLQSRSGHQLSPGPPLWLPAAARVEPLRTGPGSKPDLHLPSPMRNSQNHRITE